MATRETHRERTDGESSLNRRAYLGALSASVAAGIAGCGGGGGGDGQDGGGGGDTTTGGSGDTDLGERVPTVVFQWPSGLGSTSASLETATQLAMEQFEEILGISTEAQPKEILTHYQEIFNDARTCHMFFDGQLAVPTLIDPHQTMMEGHISWAGANGRGSRSQYANCEYSQLVDEEVQTADPAKRREIVNEALSIASEDVERINLGPSVARGAFRTDMVEFPEPGNWGYKTANYDLITGATVKDADALSWNQTASAVTSRTHPVSEDTVGLLNWNYLVYHPLVRYDRNYELVSGLAEDWEISNNAKTFTFTLRDGLTFHNGDPVTPEDVKWTYEFLNDNTGVYVQVTQRPYESINVVDDRTVEINLSRPSAPYLRNHVAMWGIFPKDVWLDAGAEDTPENVQLDPIVGSGPYEVANFDRSRLLELEPTDDFFDAPSHNLRLQVYQDTPSAYRAFQNGDIAWLRNANRQITQEIEQNMGDSAQTNTLVTFFDQWLISQMNYGPTKFREFRMAASQAFDRQRESQVVDYGASPPHLYSCFFGKEHPFYPDNPDEVLTKIAETPQSNPEAARAALRENGWGWDDQDRLHYPSDADLEPRWPKGDSPLMYPDKFPCVTNYETPSGSDGG